MLYLTALVYPFKRNAHLRRKTGLLFHVLIFVDLLSGFVCLEWNTHIAHLVHARMASQRATLFGCFNPLLFGS